MSRTGIKPSGSDSSPSLAAPADHNDSFESGLQFLVCNLLEVLKVTSGYAIQTPFEAETKRLETNDRARFFIVKLKGWQLNTSVEF